MRVGICWQGSATHRNDAMRSLPRGAVAGLASIQGVEWVSLAKDAWTPAMGEAGLINGLEGCDDWLDTSCRLLGRTRDGYPDEQHQPIDLIITVDTAIAHIGGGLGIPVWLMVAAVPDFRWMLPGVKGQWGESTTRTPWYDSVTLYRQEVAGEWEPVIARIAADLAAMTEPMREAA